MPSSPRLSSQRTMAARAAALQPPQRRSVALRLRAQADASWGSPRLSSLRRRGPPTHARPRRDGRRCAPSCAPPPQPQPQPLPVEREGAVAPLSHLRPRVMTGERRASISRRTWARGWRASDARRRRSPSSSPRSASRPRSRRAYPRPPRRPRRRPARAARRAVGAARRLPSPRRRRRARRSAHSLRRRVRTTTLQRSRGSPRRCRRAVQLLVYSSMCTCTGRGTGTGRGRGRGMHAPCGGAMHGRHAWSAPRGLCMVCAPWSVHGLCMVCARLVAGAARWEAQQRGTL